jgi:hypothetical protein
MDYQTRLKQIQDQTAKLKEREEELINELKTKHHDFYLWMVKNHVNPHNLSRYGASVATALTLVMKPGDFSIKYVPDPPKPQNLAPIVQVIEVDELKGLSEDEKLKLVKERYGHIVKRVAEKYSLDPKLLYATIMLESGGNTYAIRHEPQINDASYGLGQILYGTARGLGFEGEPNDLFDPEVNIELIGKYHRRNADVYGSELTPQQLTIAYNSGSPYNTPYPGHMSKFDKWFEKVGNLLV